LSQRRCKYCVNCYLKCRGRDIKNRKNETVLTQSKSTDIKEKKKNNDVENKTSTELVLLEAGGSKEADSGNDKKNNKVPSKYAVKEIKNSPENANKDDNKVKTVVGKDKTPLDQPHASDSDDSDIEDEDPDRIIVSTVEFKGRSDDKWYKIFLGFGILPTFCTVIALMAQMWGMRPGSTGEGLLGRLSLTTTYDHEPTTWLQKNDFYTKDFHQYPTVLEHFSIDLLFPRIILPFVAMCLDITIVYLIAYDIRLDVFLKQYLNCLPTWLFRPRNRHKYTLIHHTSRMLDVEGTMKRDKFIIDDGDLNDPDENERPMGVIRLFRIKNVYGIHDTHAKVIAGMLIFTCIPWASIAMLCADNTTRFPGIAASILLGIRTISGHLGFVDIMYGIRQFASSKALRFYMVGDETFSKPCFKTGMLCTLGGSAASGLVLLYMYVEAPPSIEIWIPLMIVTSVSFLIFGFGLGCSRNFPIRHVLKMTSLKNNVAIRYKEVERCCFDCDRCENWALGFCARESDHIMRR
jgi:hypothetical protein